MEVHVYTAAACQLHVLSGTSVDVIAMNITYIQAKWRIAASISVGLPENRRLVQVLSLRMISGECNIPSDLCCSFAFELL